jgi:hypothetical protein
MIKKQCKICGKELEIKNFHKDAKSKDGYKNICKKCRSTRTRKIITEERKRFDRNIKHAIYMAIKNNKEGGSWENLVGYNLKQLKKYLESKFDKNMNWDNFGSYWWIDKIIPVRAYNFSIYGEFKKCWSLKNLRPLQKNKCMLKSDKLYLSLVKKYNLFDIMPLGTLFFNKEEGDKIETIKKNKLKKLIQKYSKKGKIDKDLKKDILNESKRKDKEIIMEELEKNLDLFDDYEDVDWSKFPVGLFYKKLFGEV